MKSRSLFFFAFLCLLVPAAQAQKAPDAGAASLSGEWELTTTVFGNPLSARLTLRVEKGKITGSVFRITNA